MLIDFYLLAQFFYYFLVLIAGFLLIFDTFTMFDLLRDISKNHVPFLVVVNYFRFLVPYMVYHLTPLATLVATLVTLGILAKNNEVIAFKASGISLYRLVLPLALAGIPARRAACFFWTINFFPTPTSARTHFTI